MSSETNTIITEQVYEEAIANGWTKEEAEKQAKEALENDWYD